jgi:Cysteine-rich CWC
MAAGKISSPLPALSASSICPRCGAAFRCGMAAGDAECWCIQLPQVMPLPSSSPAAPDIAAVSCLCPVCLQQKLDTDAKPRLPAQD